MRSVRNSGGSWDSSFVRKIRPEQADAEYRTKNRIAVSYDALKPNAQKSRHDNKKCQELVEASWEGNYEKVKKLLADGVDPNNCVYETMSPLFAAARYGKNWAWDRNIDTVKLLVNAGADVHFKTEKGLTPTYIAGQQGHTETARYLASQGGSSSDAKKGINENVAAEKAGLAALGVLGQIATSTGKAISDGLKSAPSNHPTCEGSKNSCFKLIPKSSYQYEVECTHGPKTGYKTKICGNDKGKWATGCGLSDAFAFHHNSPEEAAIVVCDLK